MMAIRGQRARLGSIGRTFPAVCSKWQVFHTNICFSRTALKSNCWLICLDVAVSSVECTVHSYVPLVPEALIKLPTSAMLGRMRSCWLEQAGTSAFARPTILHAFLEYFIGLASLSLLCTLNTINNRKPAGLLLWELRSRS
jgi:hypothetical protein